MGIRKKFIILATIISLYMTIFLSGCITPTGGHVDYVLISYDGSKLISYTRANPGHDIIVWNITSGEEILKLSKDARDFSFSISYDGSFIGFYDDAFKNSCYRIYNTSSGINVINFSTSFLELLLGSNYLIVHYTENNTIEMWDYFNFTKIRNITLNETFYKDSLSLFDNKIFYVLANGTLSVFDIYSENKTILNDVDLNDTISSSNVYWPNNGKEIGLAYPYDPGDISNHTYRIIKWSLENNSILSDNFLSVPNHEWPTFSPDLKKYAYTIYDSSLKKSIFKIYNLSDNKLLYSSQGSPSVSWSGGGNLIAFGTSGNINVLNINSGEIIQTLYTPKYEFVPGFELILMVIAFVLVLFLQRKKI